MSVFINKHLLEHSHANSFMYCLCTTVFALLWRTEWVWQRWYVPQGLKYLQSRHLQERFADPSPKHPIGVTYLIEVYEYCSKVKNSSSLWLLSPFKLRYLCIYHFPSTITGWSVPLPYRERCLWEKSPISKIYHMSSKDESYTLDRGWKRSSGSSWSVKCMVNAWLHEWQKKKQHLTKFFLENSAW